MYMSVTQGTRRAYYADGEMIVVYIQYQELMSRPNVPCVTDMSSNDGTLWNN